MRYTKQNFIPVPGQKYKVGRLIVILIPKPNPAYNYIGEVISGGLTGWSRGANPENVGDYKAVATDTYWGFVPCFAHLIQDEEEVIYDIY